MDKEIIEYVKKCPTCQLEKTTRIKYQAESIIQKIRVPTKPNDKIALGIYPLARNNKRTIHLCSINTSTRKERRIIRTHNPFPENIHDIHMSIVRNYENVFKYRDSYVPTDLTLKQKC